MGDFEHLAKRLYQQIPNAPLLPRKNVFQNVSDGSRLWLKVKGKGYEGILSVRELDDLTRLFQQRHVLMHCSAIVDQEYIQKSKDQTYAVGQRLIARETDVLRLADLVSKLATELRRLV